MSYTTWILVAVFVAFLVYRMKPAKGVKSIPSNELNEMMKNKKQKFQFIDVREPHEFESGHVSGFKNIPLSQLSGRHKEISKDQPTVLMCRSGARSMQAAKRLSKSGHRELINVSGGIMGWKGPVRKG